jgi:hypothetical protein
MRYPNINYGFRPESYWRETDPLGLILRNVKGENRRQIIRQYFAEGRLDELEPNILKDEVDDRTRLALGAIHPSFLGGEFLPEYDDNEVEIARIALESATADVISVRASAVSGGIAYSVVDEYDGVFFLPFTESTEPLPLAELIRLLDDGAMEGNPYPGGLAQSNNLANAGAWYRGSVILRRSRRTFTRSSTTTTSRSSPRGSRTKRPRTRPGSSRQAGEAHQDWGCG